MLLWALLAILARAACAQIPAPTPAEMVRGRDNPAQVAGLDDAEDARILERTLYGRLGIEDLTEQQAEEMLAAATRRFERRQARVQQAKELVEEGALPRLALTPLLEELDRSRREMGLAASRARLLRELAAMARAEQALLAKLEEVPAAVFLPELAERYDGSALFASQALRQIALAFEKRFSKPLPVSARGDTAVHRALGFDHRGRVDVALDPDQGEGVWLRDYLRSRRIPFIAFRAFMAGRSTGPHIHIGPPSSPLRSGGG